jgi:hypothetical protein
VLYALGDPMGAAEQAGGGGDILNDGGNDGGRAEYPNDGRAVNLLQGAGRHRQAETTRLGAG